MLVTPDFSEIAEQKNDTIADGIYKARIEGVEAKTSKAGDPMLSWKLVIFGAEGDYARFNNWPLFYTTMQKGRGAGILQQFYRAATKTNLMKPSFDTDDLLGKEIQVTVKGRLMPDGTPSRWPDIGSVRSV